MNFDKYEQIIQIIRSRRYLENKDTILDFIRNNELKYYFLNKIPKKFDNLQEIEFLLNKLIKGERPFEVFNILKESINEKNNDFIIRFIQKYYRDLERKHHDDLFQNKALRIIKNISEKDFSTFDSIFSLVKSILKLRKDKYKEFKTKREYSEEKKLISKLLEKVFSIYKEQRNSEKIKEIVKLIDKHFNLVGDDGEFSHYAPKEIFDILKDYVDLDFENNFQEIVKILVCQYSDEFEKFDGRELIGGGTSFWGHNYSVSDRHFIGYTLEPILQDYYRKNKNKTWKFILSSCITKTGKVSKNRPDFLNRAVIPIVLERYGHDNKKISEEAFGILKEFILSRKGIPPKSDLVYQELRSNRHNFSGDKIWKLIEVSINKYGVPISIFVEEIVADLAKNKHKGARKALKSWLKNPKYYEKFRFEMNIVQNIRTVLDSDFDYAVNLFEDFIASDYFAKAQERFESYEVANLLYDIIERGFERGLKIIKGLSKQKSLTENQQIALCYSLLSRGEGKADNPELLDKVHEEFINPFLSSFDNDIKKISQKITFSQAREAFVQFAEKLAQNKEIEKALRIVRVFINDPDPYLPGKDPEDPKVEYNEHKNIEKGEEPHTITSVRGWCGWVLMKCSVLAGRDYIGELIDLTEQLAKDKNWYVKHMACFALSQLARNRLTVLPSDKNILFFGKDTEEALDRSKRVERIAFDLLGEIAKASDNVKKALAKSILTAFDHIRIPNEKEALVFVNTFKKFPDEAIAEAAPLFIFFAEFRKNTYKDWKWKTDKYYNDLEPFDDKRFKKILLGIIDKLEPEKRTNFASHFEHLIRESNLKTAKGRRNFDTGYKYFDYLADEYNHNLFEMIYMTIKNGMEKQYKFNNWYELYIKCLKKEKAFYDKNFKEDKTMDMYWWPSMYNKYILISVYEQGGRNKFLEAFSIIVSFPRQTEICDSDEIISLLKEIPKSNKTAKKTINRLFERNSSKYYELRSQWFGEK